MKLTKAQLSFLESAAKYTPPTAKDAVHWETAGVAAWGARLPMAERLMNMGLLSFVGIGVDVDDHMVERQVYAITDAGRAMLQSGEEP